jgi:hypothetical protein
MSVTCLDTHVVFQLSPQFFVIDHCMWAKRSQKSSTVCHRILRAPCKMLEAEKHACSIRPDVVIRTSLFFVFIVCDCADIVSSVYMYKVIAPGCLG